ncbi:hypothetical protein RIVM261_074440 [Rivularia sp. IAM M-261]|nr:hypothetical protein CAL7716_047650 [Calothrix sp. PCC 7716]GJD22488.1 hypothetical protein RIVM261_074440 [Rivularia sp. IAM M-261]
MTDEELKLLIENNARTAQEMLDSMVEARLERQELRYCMIRLEDGVERLINVQEDIANLLASLDSDRLTVLRKLNSIENKVDIILQKSEEGEIQ